MVQDILLLFLLHSVSSLNIRIDGDNGNDSKCLTEQPQSSCQSLKYVADTINSTGSLTIEIISPTLSVQDNVSFTGINRLAINGQGETLTAIQVQSATAGISFLHCGEIILASFTLTTVTESLLYDSHLISEDQCSFTTNDDYSLFFSNPKKLTIKNCNFTSSNDTHAVFNGALINLSNTTTAASISIDNVIFSNFRVGLKVLVYKSFHITLDVESTEFINNGIGFDIIAINSSNNSISVTACQFNGNGYHGLKVSYNTSCSNNFTIFGCGFFNNTGCNGVSMDLALAMNSTSNNFRGIGSRFIHNSAKYAGGGLNIDLSPPLTGGYHEAYPSNNTITFQFCYFNNNNGSYAGGVGVLMASVSLDYKKEPNDIKFDSCKFNYNRASSGSAVHINRNIPSESGAYFVALVYFYNCNFTGNGQPHLKSKASGNAALQSGAFYANKVWVNFGGKTQFIDNNITALQVSDTSIEFKDNSKTIFKNNSGIKGGAILLTGDSELYVKYNTSMIFNGNRAVSYGGAIAVLHLQVQNLAYSDKCFLSVNFYTKYEHNSKPVFNFTDNKCDSDFGNDLFISNLESCRARCKRLSHVNNVSISDIFSSKCFGTFNFSARSIATPTKNLNVSQVVNAIPGIPLKLNITAKDMFANDTSALFPLTLTISGTNSIRINPHVITNKTHVTFYGNPHETAQLLIQTETMTSITVTAKLNLMDCPPGFIFDKVNSCVCSALTSNRYQGIRYCTSNYSAITTNFWAGYLNLSNVSDNTFLTGHCSVKLCSYNNTNHRFGFYQLPIDYDKEKLDEVVCSHNRIGPLCTKCIENHTVLYHSPSFKCEPFHHCRYGILLYILSELLPITIIFIVIIIFNIYLTSGTLYTFIFYAQIIDNMSPNGFNTISFSRGESLALDVLQTVYGLTDFNILNADSLSFCILNQDLSILDLFMFKYATTLYALCLVLATIIILKLNSLYTCIKLCQKCGRRNIRGSVINGLTAFIVLCYCQSVSITCKVLLPSKLVGKDNKVMKTVLFFDGEIGYGSMEHFYYIAPAIICLMVIILPPPIILLSEPLLVRVSGVLNIRRNAITYTLHRLRMKLKPFLDSFQGCFKDNCRCFAGLFFLYRILILLPMTYSESIDMYYINANIFLFLVLLVHSTIRPFENKWHNYLDLFLLTNLVLFNMLTISNYFISVWKTDEEMYIGIPIPVIQLILMLCPIIIILAIPIVYFTGGRIKILRNRHLERLDDLNSSFPARMLEDNIQMTESYGTF